MLFDVECYFCYFFFLEVDFRRWSFPLEIFVQKQFLHFIAKQLYFRKGLDKTPEILQRAIGMLLDETGTNVPHVSINEEQLMGNSVIELEEITIRLQVVSSNSVESVRQVGKKQTQQIYQQVQV